MGQILPNSSVDAQEGMKEEYKDPYHLLYGQAKLQSMYFGEHRDCFLPSPLQEHSTPKWEA